ncbi:MAG: type II toxin-antitoxin system Phd/YefM family antitoxin [Pseudonocardiaceae bacterium]
MADVLPTNEARTRLNQIAATFDRVGAAGEPITFGSHRRPQAVIVPWELWRQLAPVIEDVLDLATTRVRLEDSGAQRIDHSDVLATLDEVRAAAGG